MITDAERLALAAHAGQVDKAGRPYIGHPARVAARVAVRYPDCPDLVAAAWLHDIVEDTDVTLDDLRAQFPADVVAIVEALTVRPHESRVAYYRRLLLVPGAREVKLEDVADNADPERLALLGPADRERLIQKYALARLYLKGVMR
jgi:hypothetical protein